MPSRGLLVSIDVRWHGYRAVFTLWALTQRARLTMLGILPKGLFNSIIMPYLGCPQRAKCVAEINLSEIERCLEST